jgi:hypothetical protein
VLIVFFKNYYDLLESQKFCCFGVLGVSPDRLRHILGLLKEESTYVP